MSYTPAGSTAGQHGSHQSSAVASTSTSNPTSIKLKFRLGGGGGGGGVTSAPITASSSYGAESVDMSHTQSAQGAGDTAVSEAGSNATTSTRPVVVPRTMAPTAVASSIVKVKRKRAPNKAPALPGPGKNWRKGLKG